MHNGQQVKFSEDYSTELNFFLFRLRLIIAPKVSVWQLEKYYSNKQVWLIRSVARKCRYLKISVADILQYCGFPE